MPNFSVPSIFWVCIFTLAFILFLATLIGRGWSVALPLRLRATSRFYLAPALGLATLTIIASVIGRGLPLGDTVGVPLFVLGLLMWAVVCERNKGQAFRHALIVSVFGMICGASVLGPLFAYGAFNPHHDAFTYLTHSNWLQQHAFGDNISTEAVTPLTTQVSLYQQEGFRMGASFLLALLQALLNLRWSYEAYPSVIISAMTACCLAIGFPLAQALRPMRRSNRLALLALPAFSLGGLVFGANSGFLPQTVGLALGASLLFMAGPIFRWLTTIEATSLANGKAALPGAALFAGATFAYSELAPFLLLALVSSGFILAVRFHRWGNLLLYIGTLFTVAILLLNIELVRAFSALRTQSGAVVGSPVDWSLLGYLAHAFGIHGGAWDGFQWATPERAGSMSFALGLLLLCLVAGVTVAGIRPMWRATLSGVLMPPVAVLVVFAGGIVYFRYFVSSPFPHGLGQSWSQFKLSDWAHPFVMALVFLALCNLRPKVAKFFDAGVVALFVICLICATLTGVTRIKPLMNYYSGVSDLDRFYLDFRALILATCPATGPIYLALGGENHKFRQMATLYLYDREVHSDWTDDGYIYPRLPKERRTQELTSGDCVVARSGQINWMRSLGQVGPFVVGVFDGRGVIRVASAAGAYGRESDGQNWWHWVEHKVVFKFKSLFIPKDSTHIKLKFEYQTRGDQILSLRLIKRDGSSLDIKIKSDGDALMIFEKLIDCPPTELAGVSIETDGKALPLGDLDTRVAAWVVRNLTVIPVSPQEDLSSR